MQQKIDYEIKMREGTTRLLAASKHPTQLLEAAKNLLTSNTRIIAYMSELQKRKTAQVLAKKWVYFGYDYFTDTVAVIKTGCIVMLVLFQVYKMSIGNIYTINIKGDKIMANFELWTAM